MLNESEKTNIYVKLKEGLSYQEIAQDFFLERCFFTIIELGQEIEAYVKERDL